MTAEACCMHNARCPMPVASVLVMTTAKGVDRFPYCKGHRPESRLPFTGVGPSGNTWTETWEEL